MDWRPDKEGKFGFRQAQREDDGWEDPREPCAGGIVALKAPDPGGRPEPAASTASEATDPADTSISNPAPEPHDCPLVSEPLACGALLGSPRELTQVGAGNVGVAFWREDGPNETDLDATGCASRAWKFFF